MPDPADHAIGPSLRAGEIAAWSRLSGTLAHGFERRAHGAARQTETRDDSRARWRAALASTGTLLLLRQVHGATVRLAPWSDFPDGDAALAETSGLLLGIETADCLPVLLIDTERRRVAAAHAGWRGTVAGVARAALDALLALGTKPEHVQAALGPAIGPCCYEVGDELRPAFAAAFGPDSEAFFHTRPGGKAHLDVRAANQHQLVAAGLAPTHIHHLDECTRCHAELYPSYRRDGTQAGRMLSWVGWRALERRPEDAR